MDPAAPRGCLLLVVQSSATMAGPLRAHGGASKVGVACRLADEVLREVIALERAGSLAPAAWDVGVVAVAGLGRVRNWSPSFPAPARTSLSCPWKCWPAANLPS